MPLTVSTEIWIQEPTGVEPDSYIWSCGNDRGVKVAKGIKVQWGKTDLLAMPTAAVATFTLIDYSNYWIERLKNRQVIGKNVVLYATPSDGTGSWFWFRGRITSMDVRRGPLDHKTGQPQYYYLDFTAADKTADFGNIVFPAGTTWPAETMIDRAIKIRNAALAVTTIADFFFDPATTAWPVSPLDVSQKTLKDVNDMFYRSDGFPFSYIPSENNVRHQRRTYVCGTPTADTTNTIKMYLGPDNKIVVIPDSMSFTDSTYGTVTYRGIWLGGNEITANFDEMYVNPGSGINAVDTTWNPSPGYVANTTRIGTGAWTIEGLRLMTYNSMLSVAGNITTASSYWYFQSSEEGAAIQHPKVKYRTKWTDGKFDNPWVARDLIEAGEKPSRVFIGGSPWSAWMGNTQPTFKIQGGTIICNGADDWEFDLNLQTLRIAPDAPISLTWGGTNTGIRWGEGAGVAGNYGFDHALTWSDMRWVNNSTTILANPITP